MTRSIFGVFDFTVIGVLILCTLHKSTVAIPSCTFHEDLIQEYDNSKGTTSIEVESQDVVGIDRSVSTSIGGSQSADNSKTKGSEVEATFGVNFWAVSSSVRAQITESSSSSNSNSTSWAKASDDTWKQQTIRMSKYNVPPGFKVRLFQEVAQCGEFTVRNSRIRRVDEDATPSEVSMKNRQKELDELELEKLRLDLAHTQDMAAILESRRKTDHEYIIKHREFDERQTHAKNAKDLQDQMMSHITGNQNKSMEFANSKHIFDVNHTLHASIQLSTLKHHQEMERKRLEIEAGKILFSETDVTAPERNSNLTAETEVKSLSENTNTLFIGILVFLIVLVVLFCSGMIYCICCGFKKLGQGLPTNFSYPKKVNANNPNSYPFMQMHVRNPHHEDQDDSYHQNQFPLVPIPIPSYSTSPPTVKMISTCYKPV